MGETIDMGKVKKCADYLRYLTLESIERANSGHPGIALGCAELGVLLYRYMLRFNPQAPDWLNRDRFILSAGHGSMLLYSLLFLSGYNVSLRELGNFRQLESNTPGHPEYDITRGIETTTGPLGQGFANAVGCALEGKVLAQRFNEEGCNLFDYTVYTLMGDGCNMEGISYEAGSLAGHLGLDNLVAIYDSNDISIDGHMDITFTEDIACRYKGLGWHVESATIKDIQDVLIKLQKLKTVKGKPRMLVLRTTIGEGLKEKRNSPAIHGSPAGADEIAYFIQHSQIKEIFREKYGKDAVEDTHQLKEIMKQRLKDREPLLQDRESIAFMREDEENRQQLRQDWLETLEKYKTKYPQKYRILSTYTDFKLPDSLRQELLDFSLFKDNDEIKPTATRAISGKVLNCCAQTFPQLMGGSADLTDSTKAKVEGTGCIKKEDFSGRKIYYGAREHAMGSIGNGLALGRNTIPFSSTFFTFFDYMKPAVRMAALMKLNHIFIFSHDSIYVGEDGPTHQPIEHLNALRLIPGIHTFRPANDVETAFAYLYFFQQMNGPVAIITSRQKFPPELFKMPGEQRLERKALYENFKKGAYIFYETAGSDTPGVIFVASGSELALALQTAKLVEEKDKKPVRVISLSCPELLAEAESSYREQLFLQAPVPLVLIEAASYRGVNLFYDPRTLLVDIESFGKSAPGKKVGEYFGFTPEAVYDRIKKELV